jgi:replicative DNA helicase
LLHWYGLPRLAGTETEQVSPSWERVRLAAENARIWLNSIFLLKCAEATTAAELETQVQEIRTAMKKPSALVVIDDCQRLGVGEQPIQARVALVTEELRALAKRLDVALLAIWPDFREHGAVAPQIWADRAVAADVVMILQEDMERTKKLVEPARAMNIHIVKNRGGDRGRLFFEFEPAFSRFTEVSSR